VQVAPVSDDVLSTLQLSELSPVGAMCGEIAVWLSDTVAGRGRRRRTDRWSLADPPARIRLETDDIGHRPLERIGVGHVIAARHVAR
jgi:hypothetical protein